MVFDTIARSGTPEIRRAAPGPRGMICSPGSTFDVPHSGPVIGLHLSLTSNWFVSTVLR